jgi:hypothetical protein
VRGVGVAHPFAAAGHSVAALFRLLPMRRVLVAARRASISRPTARSSKPAGRIISTRRFGIIVFEFGGCGGHYHDDRVGPSQPLSLSPATRCRDAYERVVSQFEIRPERTCVERYG